LSYKDWSYSTASISIT